MNDHELRDAYESALQRRDKASPPLDLPLDRLEALINGEGDEADHPEAQLAHGVLTTDVRFSWRSGPSARDYMLVVVDTAGGDVFAQNTTDTSVTLPDSVKLSPGGEYLWWVQATMPDGATLSAVTERFRVKR